MIARLNRVAYARERPSVRTLGDVFAVYAYLLIIGVIMLAGIEGPVRLGLAVPLLVVLPGYALLSLVYPAHSRQQLEELERPTARRYGRGLAWRDRLLLSFGMSIVLLPLFGFVVTAVAGGVSPTPAVAVPAAFVFVCMLLGGIRRWRLPAELAYRVPTRSWRWATETAVFNAPNRREAVLNVVLILVVAGAVIGMAAAVIAPPTAEHYTDLTLLTTDGGGNYVEAGYPVSFDAGEAQPLVAAVTNHEATAVEYTVVIEVQRVSTDGSTATVLERSEVARQRNTVAQGETWYWDHEVATQMLGTDLRLTYLLYQGQPPDSPSMETAYRSAYIWLDVTQPETADT